MAGYLWRPPRNNCRLLYIRPASPEKTLSHFTSSNESDSCNVTKTSKTLDKIFFFLIATARCPFSVLLSLLKHHGAFGVHCVWTCSIPPAVFLHGWLPRTSLPGALVSIHSLMSPKSCCFAGFWLGNTPLNHSVGQVGSIPSIHWLWALWDWVARPCMSSKWSRGAFSWAFPLLHLILWTVLKEKKNHPKIATTKNPNALCVC